VYVNSRNHHFDPQDYLDGIPGEKIGQFHLAGHTDMGEFLFDTHSGEVIDPVWDLYRAALARWGKVSTLIEWDENIPEFKRLAEEAARARAIYGSAETFIGKTPDKTPPRKIEISSVPAPSAETLDTTQKWFKRRIMPYKTTELEGQSSPLNPQGNATGEERLSVYSNGYHARITDALKEVYEAVHHVAGHETFHRAAARYSAQYPSLEYNLSLAGRCFSAFLAKDKLTEKLPFLPDLSALEWKVSEAFHSFDRTPMSTEKVGAVPAEQWDAIIFDFQPSMSLIASAWPVFDIWRARKTPVDQIRVELKDRPQCVLVYRSALEVRCALISRTQFDLLASLKSGRTLGEACGIAEDAAEDTPLQEWFSQWIQAGIITGAGVDQGKRRDRGDQPALSDIPS